MPIKKPAKKKMVKRKVGRPRKEPVKVVVAPKKKVGRPKKEKPILATRVPKLVYTTPNYMITGRYQLNMPKLLKIANSMNWNRIRTFEMNGEEWDNGVAQEDMKTVFIEGKGKSGTWTDHGLFPSTRSIGLKYIGP